MSGVPSPVRGRPRALADATEPACRAVLFDPDGVLVRSGAVVERSWTEWARGRGLHR